MRITNKELKIACEARRTRELKAIWPEVGMTVVSVSRRKATSHKAGRILTAAACLLLALIAWLSLDRTALAKVETWVKIVKDHWMGVRPNSTNSETAFRYYTLGWLPERFEHLLNEEYASDCYLAEYNTEHYRPGNFWKGETGSWGSKEGEVIDHFAWGYYKISEWDEALMRVGYFDPEDDTWNILSEEEIQVQGRDVLCYVYTLKAKTASGDGEALPRRNYVCCIWTDPEADIAFRLDGNITREEAVKIIETIGKK